jgi:hypothetical protein
MQLLRLCLALRFVQLLVAVRAVIRFMLLAFEFRAARSCGYVFIGLLDVILNAQNGFLWITYVFLSYMHLWITYVSFS